MSSDQPGSDLLESGDAEQSEPGAGALGSLSLPDGVELGELVEEAPELIASRTAEQLSRRLTSMTARIAPLPPPDELEQYKAIDPRILDVIIEGYQAATTADRILAETDRELALRDAAREDRLVEQFVKESDDDMAHRRWFSRVLFPRAYGVWIVVIIIMIVLDSSPWVVGLFIAAGALPYAVQSIRGRLTKPEAEAIGKAAEASSSTPALLSDPGPGTPS